MLIPRNRECSFTNRSCARIAIVVIGLVLHDHCNDHRTLQGTPFRGTQNLTLLSNVNLVMSMLRVHLIRRTLGVGESNLETLVMWKLRSPGRLN
jgi:hypothetical protein